MRARVAFAILLCTLLGIAQLGMSAQQGAASFPVIVVFNENASLQAYAGRYQADDRAAANPAAWEYHDRGVAGAVQDLEARHAFRSERVFSAAIRGFAGRLTARQIADLRTQAGTARPGAVRAPRRGHPGVARRA
jgi:hypothetical protein